MTIEKLTDEERKALERGDVLDGPKALRLLDAHAADRAALVAQLEAAQREWPKALDFELLESQVAELTRERDEARDKLQMQQTAQHVEGLHWEAKVTRLTEALAAAEELAECERQNCCRLIEQKTAAEARVRELEAHLVASDGARSRAESECAALRAQLSNTASLTQWTSLNDECAALRAEVERLRLENRDIRNLNAVAARAAHTAESRLAAANALLGEVSGIVENPCLTVYATLERLKGALAAHPATAPARDEESCDAMREANELRLDAAQRYHEDSRGERACRGCREGTQDHHTCQRAIIPPQTYLPPSVLRSLQKEDEDNE